MYSVLKRLMPMWIFALLLLANQIHASEWRKLDPAHTALMTLPHGQVVIELAPWAAPKHVAQFERLVKQGYYNGNKFYRVIDGFVAQAGPREDSIAAPSLAMESEWQPELSWSWLNVEQHDMFAPQTGFYRGFAVGYQSTDNLAWLTHCPGVLAMARGNDADSGTSHFYFTIGQAPRYLDRIMAVFGRVVYGLDKIQAITRTQVIEGQADVSEQAYTPIIKLQLMADVPPAEQLMLEIEDTSGSDFAQAMSARKHRSSEFFYKKPPPVLDVCQIPVKTRLISKK